MRTSDKKVYMDYAATTPVDERVFGAMRPYFCDTFGNADSVHSFGMEAAVAVDDARRRIAALMGATRTEIYFTSGGTEADNWAVKGGALAASAVGRKKIVISAIEHPAVTESAMFMRKLGFEVVRVPVDGQGRVRPEDVGKVADGGTAIVSVMLANNEVGTVQPAAEIAKIAHDAGALFHTDAVQAAGGMRLDVKSLGADMMTISSHKFYGPKGCGVLYVKKGITIEPLISGGHQERGARGGTTNVAAVVGMAEALALAYERLDDDRARISSLRDEIFEIYITKHQNSREHRGREMLPGHANIMLPGVDGRALLPLLDMAGVACSLGSACSSGSVDPSPVLLAMGLREADARSSVRFSLGRYTTADDVAYAADAVAAAWRKLSEN